jgi:hypothetical protein
MSSQQRQGMIFDEEQPDLLNPLNPSGSSKLEHNGPFILEEEAPLQRPRPPERPRKRPSNSGQTQAEIYANYYENTLFISSKKQRPDISLF